MAKNKCDADNSMNDISSKKHKGDSNYHFGDVGNLVLEGELNYYNYNSNNKNERNTVVILWDIVTCPVPEGKSTLALITKIRTKFITVGYKEQLFACFFDVKNMAGAIIEDILKSKVVVEPTEKKDTVNKLKEKVKEYHQAAVADKKLVVISNCVNTQRFLSDIKSTHFVDVVLIYNDVPSKAVLEYKKACHFHYNELIKDLLDLDINETKISDKTNMNSKEGKGDLDFNRDHSETFSEMIVSDGNSKSDSHMSVDDIQTDGQLGTSQNLTFTGDGINQPTNWKRGQFIDKGGFGKVYHVDDHPSKKNMVVKQVNDCHKDNTAEKAALFKEFNILKELKHPKIVTYYGFCEKEGILSLFIERIDGGSLKKYLEDDKNDKLDPIQIGSITKQILEGVSYLHSRRTIHRDIKSGNILLEENLNIKLADFGVSKIFQEMSRATTKKVGTIRWMAPEILDESKHYSYEVDIWAIGCTVFEMLTRKVPFHNLEEDVAIMFRLATNPSPANDLQSCPKEIKDFFSLVFQKDAKQRPTADQLLASNPFVNGSMHDK